MSKRIKQKRVWKTVGLDVGDRKSAVWALDEAGEAAWSGTIGTSEQGMERLFKGKPPMRILLEAGSHAHWLSWSLEALEHEVIIVNPRRLGLVTQNDRKSDMRDARILAEMGHADTSLKQLSPVRPKTKQQLLDRATLVLRRELVASRTSLVLSVRGLVKAANHRLPARSPASFHKLDLSSLPPGLAEDVSTVMQAIYRLNEQIKELNRKIASIAKERYPVTSLLRQVNGVGPITALFYVLTIWDPQRFEKSRDVGAYVGLVPRRHQSGTSEPQLRVTKAGDRQLRSLLVQGAHYILGPFGEDSDLKRFGQRIIDRGGRYPKRRAVVAVARKLAVLLHSLWRSAEEYDPLRNANAVAR